MKFHNNRLTPTQALRELVQIAQASARQQARPFANVLELLADPESEAQQSEKLSPAEAHPLSSATRRKIRQLRWHDKLLLLTAHGYEISQDLLYIRLFAVQELVF